MIAENKARRIVAEITKIIPQKLNIINSDGIILASSEPERVGQRHEGALRLFDSGLEELVIHSDDEYAGGRVGMVLPIEVRAERLGAIAITGAPEQIRPYAQIVRRMTEILLLEDVQNQEYEQMQILRNRYLSEWLHGEQTESMASFVDRGKALGIDITLPRRVVILDVVSQQKSQPLKENIAQTSAAEKKLRAVFEELYDKRPFYLLEKSYFIVGVPELDDKQIQRHIDYATRQICSPDGVCLRIGIDGGVRRYTEITKAYTEARRAWKANRREFRQVVRFYNDIDMEIFIDEISDTTKWEYIHKIFPGFSAEEIAESLKILQDYYAMDGSITKASERLFIHKNTLQKKLIRIAERTGKDPRSHRYAFLYANALYFYNYLK